MITSAKFIISATNFSQSPHFALSEVAFLGRSNVGKSSLINALSERKLALISPKQNATRRKIRAIIMFEGAQIIFTDAKCKRVRFSAFCGKCFGRHKRV